jgi:hypothetical protein
VATFVNDTFSGATGGALSAHTGEVGATWTNHPSFSTADPVITAQNRVRGPAAAALVYASGVPATADYDVQADVVARSAGSGSDCGVTGRTNTSTADCYRSVLSGLTLFQQKIVGGSTTTLGSFVYGSLATDQVIVVKQEMRGTGIVTYEGGVSRVTSTDSAHSAAGRAGVSTFSGGTDTTGNQIDNFSAVDAVSARRRRMLLGKGR